MHFGLRFQRPDPSKDGAARNFIARMRDVQGKGVDFELFAREALKETLGDGPSEVLFTSLGSAAKENPEYFAFAMSKMFAQGAEGIFEPMIKRADMGLFPHGAVDHVADLERYALEHPASGPASFHLDEARLAHRRLKDEHGDQVNEDD